MKNGTKYLRGVFLGAHLVWALIGVAVCVVLSQGGGHPPAMILIPPALVVWIAGHGALWAIRRLALTGRVFAAGTGSQLASWPPGLIVVLLGTGIASSVGLIQLVGTVVDGRKYPFRGEMWDITMVIWSLHGLCFVGLLLRRPWSRWVTALLSLGWAAFLAWQLFDHFHRRTATVVWSELAIAVGVLCVLIFLGYYALASKRVRAFLDRSRVAWPH